MRYRLPVNQYLEVLHRAATTGQLYEYNARGDLIGTRQVTPKEQLETTRYLLDKAMPDQAPQRLDQPDELTMESQVANLQALDTDQLRRLIEDHSNDPIQFPTPVCETSLDADAC